MLYLALPSSVQKLLQYLLGFFFFFNALVSFFAHLLVLDFVLSSPFLTLVYFFKLFAIPLLIL